MDVKVYRQQQHMAILYIFVDDSFIFSLRLCGIHNVHELASSSNWQTTYNHYRNSQHVNLEEKKNCIFLYD
jgi:vacuolar-type H+-ATPase subunit F/Vma7